MELAGYTVWHELDRLKGGDHFWDKIEKAIREESFRFLAVVSKVSVGKPGVKDEWALAQTIEKSLPGMYCSDSTANSRLQLMTLNSAFSRRSQRAASCTVGAGRRVATLDACLMVGLVVCVASR